MGLQRPGGNRTKWAAVGVVALLEFSAVFYLYGVPVVFPSQGPRTFASTYSTSTSTTTTTTKPTTSVSTTAGPPAVVVKSALIAHDALLLDIKNNGAVPTQDLAITNVCSPGFQNCLQYSSLAGKTYQKTFVLPAGREYTENLTGICVFDIAHCTHYYPVANATYYLTLKVDMSSGSSVTIPIAAMANDTTAPETSVWGANATLDTFSGNLSGSLTVWVVVNDTFEAVNYTAALNSYAGKTGFSLKVVANETGCGGDVYADCSQPVDVGVVFSLVNAGVTPKTVYAVVLRDEGAPTPVYFALWVKSPSF